MSRFPHFYESRRESGFLLFIDMLPSKKAGSSGEKKGLKEGQFVLEQCKKCCRENVFAKITMFFVHAWFFQAVFFVFQKLYGMVKVNLDNIKFLGFISKIFRFFQAVFFCFSKVIWYGKG